MDSTRRRQPHTEGEQSACRQQAYQRAGQAARRPRDIKLLIFIYPVNQKNSRADSKKWVKMIQNRNFFAIYLIWINMGDWDGQLSWLQARLAISPVMPQARLMAALYRGQFVYWC